MKHALARAHRALVPASVLLTLTHKCQLACAHCYQATHDSEDLSTTELVSLFDELALLGTLELTFSGGEALLRKDLFTLIAEARKRAFSVTLFTNGGPVTAEVARLLRELRVQSVEISLHGVHAATHDGFVGREGTFERALRAIEHLADAGLPVMVKSNVVRCNAEEIGALRELFAARPRVRFMADVLLHRRNDGASVLSERATPEQIGRYFAGELARAPQEELLAIGRQLQDVPDESTYESQSPCGAGRTFAAIEPNGDVLSCTHLLSRPLGNLRRDRFSALWLSSPELEAMRRLSIARFIECRGCEFRHVCGKCPALSMNESGALDGHSQQICDRTKAFWGAAKARLGLPPPPASSISVGSTTGAHPAALPTPTHLPTPSGRIPLPVLPGALP